MDGKIIATPGIPGTSGRPSGRCLGGEFIREGLETSVDPLTLAGLAPGINQNFPSAGSRQRYPSSRKSTFPSSDQRIGFLVSTPSSLGFRQI